MSKIRLDFSFERNGKDLSALLRMLVSDDVADRVIAGDAIMAMLHALPYANADLSNLEPRAFDSDARRQELTTAIRSAIKAPDFDLPDFMRRLNAHEYASEVTTSTRVKKLMEPTPRDTRFELMAERLAKKINDPSSALEKQEAMKRFARLTAAYICGAQDGPDLVTADELLISMGRIVVFEALGEECLADPDSIHLFSRLSSRQWQKQLGMLQRGGRAAAELVPLIMGKINEEIEADPEFGTHCQEEAVLASIAEGSHTTFLELLSWLSSPQTARRRSAARIFELFGPNLCGLNQTVVDALTELLRNPKTARVALGALASVGRHDSSIRSLVLGFARPAPPRIQVDKETEEQYDDAMRDRAMAINSMRYFTDYAPECLPHLIDALSNFQEFDYDFQRSGPAARISQVLAEFGPAAGQAATALVSHMDDDEDEYPKAICGALSAMGSAAAHVLPHLEQRWLREDETNTLDKLTDSSSESRVSSLGSAIQAIRRATSS